MKRYIKSSAEFDLHDDDTLFEVSEWISEEVRTKVFNRLNRRRKKNFIGVWLDDVSINSNTFYCQVWADGDSPQGRYLGDFTCRLHYYDASSADFEDVKYLVDDALGTFIRSL